VCRSTPKKPNTPTKDLLFAHAAKVTSANSKPMAMTRGHRAVLTRIGTNPTINAVFQTLHI
jgi:hypothetical protein